MYVSLFKVGKVAYPAVRPLGDIWGEKPIEFECLCADKKRRKEKGLASPIIVSTAVHADDDT